MGKRRGFWQLVRDMKRWDDLDRDERDSVTVGVTMGFLGGAVVILCPASCVILIVIGVVTQ